MSTKIYNGFKVKGLNFNKLANELVEIRKKAQIVANELAHKNQVFLATVLYDSVTLGLEQAPKYSYLNEIRGNQIKEQIEFKKTQHRCPDIDFSLSICVYPISRRKIVGAFFTEQEALSSLITTQPWYQEYGYWNNTDRPENISQRQWNQRKKDWSLLKWGVPTNQSMLTFICTEEVFFSSHLTEESNVILPEFDKRVFTMMRKMLHQQSGYMEWWEFRDKDGAGEFDELKESLKKEISLKLNPNLTLKDLLSKI